MNSKNCEFLLMTDSEAASLVLRERPAGSGFSFVRLGDGEGLLLSITEASPDRDFQYLRQHIGAAANDIGIVLQLKRELVASIRNADLLGIRDDIVGVAFDERFFTLPEQQFLEKFRDTFRLRPAERELGFDGARRIALLHRELGRLDLESGCAYCSAWLHYRLHCSGFLFGLLKKQDRIGAISCRSELPGLLASLLDLPVAFHQIPDMYRNIARSTDASAYLPSLEAILRKQLVEFPGMLFLVGAGLFGKAYCRVIKAQGGVALDVGSLLDAWVGIPSRPAVYSTEYRDVPRHRGVPVTLLLNAVNVKSLCPDDWENRCKLGEDPRWS